MNEFDSEIPTHANQYAAQWVERCRAREHCVGIIGLGYVGLPIVRAMHDAGFRVIGFDIDESKIEKLNQGEPYLSHLGKTLYQELAASDRFEPTSDPGRLADADALLLCVPTPLGPHREPDLQFVERSTEMVADVLRSGQLIVLESTSYPGTTREVCLPILQNSANTRALELGRDWFLAFSPEREDPGRTSHTTSTTPRLVGGVEPQSGICARELYAAAIDEVIEVSSAEVAEAAKLLENIYRSVNIALVNELAGVFGAMDIDIREVVAAASTKPFGYQPFQPGPGLGGHCIPVDPFYLAWKARQVGKPTRFIELAGEVNSLRPKIVIERMTRAMNEDGKPVNGSNVLVIGIAYKKNIDDVRETPAAEIIQRLTDLGSNVSYHDPHIAAFPKMRKFHFPLTSVPLTEDSLRDADCILIVTDHDDIDWKLVGDSAQLIVDTRGVMANIQDPIARVVKV